MAVSAWILLPGAPSPAAREVADRYLAAEYPSYRVVGPATATRLGSVTWLTYPTEYDGTPANAVIVLARQEGRWVVRDANILIGKVDTGRIVRYLASLFSAWALICLVFFFAIPRMFGRKCPRDLTLLVVDDKVVVPERYHKSGVSFEPIIEREYACRICDFRHYEALPDPVRRGSSRTGWGPKLIWAVSWVPVSDESEAKHDANVITKEQHEQLLSDAKKAAREKTSLDSPWLY